MNYLKFILADDHKLFRDALKMLITNEQLGTVLAEAGNGKELLEILKKNRPDIILLDISMPEMNGIEASKLICEKYPEIKIIALSMYGEEEYYYKMINAGVKGFVLKSSGMYEFEEAIKRIVKGENYFSNEILTRIIANMNKTENTKKTEQVQADKLTKRETDVLKQICMGKTNAEIAEELFISPTTVKGHRQNLLAKTDSNNTASLVMFAIKHKIVAI